MPAHEMSFVILPFFHGLVRINHWLALWGVDETRSEVLVIIVSEQCRVEFIVIFVVASHSLETWPIKHRRKLKWLDILLKGLLGLIHPELGLLLVWLLIRHLLLIH